MPRKVSDSCPQLGDIERFIAFVQADPDTYCWNWTGKQNSKFYGYFWYNQTTAQAYRFSYETFRGPIPEGLEIDHLCRNTSCVNPDHLEVVTRRENLLRGSSPVGINVRKLHCVHGHPFNEKNTRVDPKSGSRYCKTCCRKNAVRYYHAKKDRRQLPTPSKGCT